MHIYMRIYIYEGRNKYAILLRPEQKFEKIIRNMPGVFIPLREIGRLNFNCTNSQTISRLQVHPEIV